MKKVFVLDTNVLIHDPASMFKFEEHEVVIPLVVIEELDRLKKGPGEIAYSARQALKAIEALRTKGQLSSGIALDGNGSFRIASAPHLAQSLSGDDRIIETALHVYRSLSPRGESEVPAQPFAPKHDEGGGNGDCPVILVSKDTAVRIKADSIGLRTEDYTHDKTSIFKQYGRVLSEYDYTNGITSIRYMSSGDELYRLRGEDSQVRVKPSKSLEGISPKNIGQRCAIDALTNPDTEVIALTGNAGTGKTLLALAAGIHQVIKKCPLYEQVLVARPVVPMGNDLGYLPGDIQEKLAPWMQPIFDNIEVILNTPRDSGKDNLSLPKYKNYQYLLDAGFVNIEPLTYIRGRSLPQRYFIVDEAQNLRPLDVKTLITRCGEGTKIVFTGDLNQIDTPYLDPASNGLAYLISRFINEENFCYLNLQGSVRSRLAEQGACLL